jgi:hypothetical protein
VLIIYCRIWYQNISSLNYAYTWISKNNWWKLFSYSLNFSHTFLVKTWTFYRVNFSTIDRFGCFQLLNHNISPQLMVAAVEVAMRFFPCCGGKWDVVMRSSRELGVLTFEEYHEGEKEGNELSEDFIRCEDEGFKLKMERIRPI